MFARSRVAAWRYSAAMATGDNPASVRGVLHHLLTKSPSCSQEEQRPADGDVSERDGEDVTTFSIKTQTPARVRDDCATPEESRNPLS